jgi:hypothetical protein
LTILLLRPWLEFAGVSHCGSTTESMIDSAWS